MYMYYAVCQTRAGTLPWRFSVLIFWNKQEDNLKQSKKPRNTISTFFLLFSFSACPKAGGRCRSTRYRSRSNRTECLPVPSSSMWNSKAQSTSENDSQRYWHLTLQAPEHFCVFFFFFFCCRSHNESGPIPLPAIWKFFRLSAMCEILRWPLTLAKNSHFSFLPCQFSFLPFQMVTTVALKLAVSSHFPLPKKFAFSLKPDFFEWCDESSRTQDKWANNAFEFPVLDCSFHQKNE